MTDKEKLKLNHITLYAYEFDRNVWQVYCDACGVPYSSVEITIWFNTDDVETLGGDEEGRSDDDNADNCFGSDFLNDEEKMRDFREMSKEDFLKSYSYLTEAEYENTKKKMRNKEDE